MNNSYKERLQAVLDKYFPEECEFESDGMKHCCVSECREDSVVENCRKCHRDRCSNPFCPLGKGILSNKRPEALMLYYEAVKLIEEAREEALSDAVLQVIPVSMHFVGEVDARVVSPH